MPHPPTQGSKMAATAPGTTIHITASKGIQKRTLFSQLSFFMTEKNLSQKFLPAEEIPSDFSGQKTS